MNRCTTDEFLGGREDAEYVRCCEESLGRLKVDVIDLSDQHRVEPKVPIEETGGATAPATNRRAAALHPTATLQAEYALWSRDPEINVAPPAGSTASNGIPPSHA